GGQGLPLDPRDTTISTITVPAAGAPGGFAVGDVITDVNILISLDHTAVGDLKIDLIGPDGTIINLVNQRGGLGNNFTNTLFDDQATNAIANGAPPFTGSFRPEGLLRIMNGKTPAGIWSLRIDDLEPSDFGQFNDWQI